MGIFFFFGGGEEGRVVLSGRFMGEFCLGWEQLVEGKRDD